LLQTHLIQFEVHGFQRNIVHCTVLPLLRPTVIPIMTYTPYHVTSLSLQIVWDELDQRIIDKAVKQWLIHIRAGVEAKDGHFEHTL